MVNLLQLEAWTIIKFIKEVKMTRTDGGGTFTSKKVIIVGILLENIKIGVRPGLWIMLYQVFAKHNEIINFNIKIKVTSQPMSYSHGQDAFIQFPVKVNNYFLKAHSCLLKWFSAAIVFTEWADWSACSVTCGTGVRSRTRTCEGGCSKTSVSDLSETEACDEGVCPGKFL